MSSSAKDLEVVMDRLGLENIQLSREVGARMWVAYLTSGDSQIPFKGHGPGPTSAIGNAIWAFVQHKGRPFVRASLTRSELKMLNRLVQARKQAR